MENLILELLLLQRRTIYEIRKKLAANMDLLYSCSTGSIQAALRKLLVNGGVQINEVMEGGKTKKYYEITEGE